MKEASMIVTISMRAETRKEVVSSGEAIDYHAILDNEPSVRLVSLYDNGRCAKLELNEDSLENLKETLGDSFVFSRNVPFESLRSHPLDFIEP